MEFKIHEYHHPNFNEEIFKNAPNCTLIDVDIDGISPRNYHALSVYPEYFKVNGKWILATESRMDAVCVVDDTIGKEKLDIVEFRNLKKGDKVVVGRREDGSEGIYIWTKGFPREELVDQSFAFRSGRSRETAFSVDYDNLYKVLKYEKENKGYISLVVSSAIALDRDSRKSLENLIRNGYVNAIFCGTETVAFDLERGIFGEERPSPQEDATQNVYDAINLTRKYGSIKSLIKSSRVKDGFIKASIESGVNLLIPGTIKDRFSLPETINNVYEAKIK